MWLLFAALSALFAGASSILAKIGISDTDSNLCTALRTAVVLIFSWIMVFITGEATELSSIDGRTLIFLILSGVCTGASWLCYFKALSVGDVNRVVPIDKSSTILTIVLSFIIFHETVGILKLFSLVILALGIFLMIEKKPSPDAHSSVLNTVVANTTVANTNARSKSGWFILAIGSALFASLTTIFGKLGVGDLSSNLGTAIRTGVALIFAWLLVILTKKAGDIRKIDKRSWIFIIASGAATGASWLCYYRALKGGVTSAVVAVDKLSLLVTIGFALIVFKEKLSRRTLCGLILMTAATLVMVIA